MFNFWKKNRNKTLFTDEIIKVRGMPANLSKGESFRTYRPRQIRSIWEPRAINRLISTSSSSGSSSENGINYSGEHKASFYRYLRDSIPIIHAGVWAWVRLCGTKINREFEGSIVEKRKAQFALDRLDYRLLEKPFGYGAGLNKLLQGAFLELFTTGKFACELVLSENGKFIDHVQILDSERIEWQHGDNGWEPYSITDEGEVIKHDSKLFFHATLGIDLTKPQGTEPLACIPFVSEVEQLMLEDMARSSHNAGVPRLQIKVARPERDSWENDSAYSNRANNYFQDVVSEFQNLEADDNIFTWSDVEVSVIGNSGVAFAWRLGREQVIEDVITGLKLFPWVLGRTHKTTQNWVQSQYDLLMQMVQSHQSYGIDLANWICAKELELQGIKCKTQHTFDRHPDPFRIERARAASLEMQNIDFLVKEGYVSKEEVTSRVLSCVLT